MKQIELAINLDPYNPQIKGLYAIDLVNVHRYNDAITVSLKRLKIDSTNSPGLTALMFSLHITGNMMKRWNNQDNILRGWHGFVHAFDQGYAKAGYIGALSLEADTLLSQSKNANHTGDLSYLYVCSGNKELALDCLERDYKMHDIDIGALALPIYDCLHNEPRFQAL